VALSTGAFVGGIVLAGVGTDRAHKADVNVRLLNQHGPAPITKVDWEREFEASKIKQATGRKIGFVGLGILAAGAGLVAATRCQGFEACGTSGQRLASFVLLGGFITSSAGFGRAGDAAQEMKWLNAHGPAAGMDVTRQRPTSAVSVSIGPV